MASDSKALVFEKIADGIVGSMFFIGELGVGPDLGRESLVRRLYKSNVLRILQLTSRFTCRSDSCSVSMAASTEARTSSIPIVETVIVNRFMRQKVKLLRYDESYSAIWGSHIFNAARVLDPRFPLCRIRGVLSNRPQETVSACRRVHSMRGK